MYVERTSYNTSSSSVGSTESFPSFLLILAVLSIFDILVAGFTGNYPKLESTRIITFIRVELVHKAVQGKSGRAGRRVFWYGGRLRQDAQPNHALLQGTCTALRKSGPKEAGKLLAVS